MNVLVYAESLVHLVVLVMENSNVLSLFELCLNLKRVKRFMSCQNVDVVSIIKENGIVSLIIIF